MKLDSTPLVTVLMPCYNAEKYINAAIESIVQQTYKNLQILLLEDGSTDSTFEICQQWSRKDERIKLIRNEKNLGLIKTLNNGITHSNSPFIARMDADDISALSRIEKQVNFLLQNDQIGIVGSKSSRIDFKGNITAEEGNVTYLSSETLSISCFFTQPFFHGSILIRTQLLKENQYSEVYKHSEDFELWLRLNSKGIKFQNLNEILYYYRVNPEGVSISNENIQIESHNKASLFYLKKSTNQIINEELVGIINNRPIKKVSYQKFKEAITFFKAFCLLQKPEIKQIVYFNRQRIDICIQSLKHSSHLIDKVYILLYFLRYSANINAIKHMIKKMI